MQVIEAILGRRSIRAYQDKPVSAKLIEEMLRAAMAAPSAGNQQPWHFVVVTDKALLAKVPEIHPHASMAPKAPLGIIVCGDPDLEKHKGYWVQDCSAAVENLLIAAHALGLGAVWTGIHPRDERADGFRKLFHIPAHVVPLAFIPIGHPAEEKPPANRFQPSRVHDNTWGNIEG